MGKRVLGFLRMVEAVTNGFTVPTSESVYKRQIGLFDAVLPSDRGILQIDGTWAEPAYITSDFCQELYTLAHAHGQSYMPVLNPGHGFPLTALYAVLDDPDLQQACADSAIARASGSFDSPWDGMVYDVRGVAAGYIQKQNDFMVFLGEQVRDAGFRFATCYHGVRVEDEALFMSLDSIRQASDEFYNYFYGWWLAPCSTGPYWWNIAGLDNALAHGIERSRIYLGFGLFSRYWPDPDYGTSHDITHDQGVQLAINAGVQVEWVENDPTGLIRESRATLGGGARVWIQDAASLQSRLSIIDDYDLAGVMLFTPGMGNEPIWRAIAEWKRPQKKSVPVRRGAQGQMTAQKLGGLNGLFSISN